MKKIQVFRLNSEIAKMPIYKSNSIKRELKYLKKLNQVIFKPPVQLLKILY